MKQQIDDDQRVYHSGNHGESTLPWECVLDCSAQGAVDDDVEFWEKHPDVELPDPAGILRALQDSGAWDDLDESVEPDQFEQEKRNRRRYLWMAACDLREDWNMGVHVYAENN